jgi:succinate-semialdehyde dehydrogenase/glutarate-semialdehyde dehydrogenase
VTEGCSSAGRRHEYPLTAPATRLRGVGVNRGIVSDPAAPFGGMKQSGLGREGAQEGIRAFQEVQFLSVA